LKPCRSMGCEGAWHWHRPACGAAALAFRWAVMIRFR